MSDYTAVCLLATFFVFNAVYLLWTAVQYAIACHLNQRHRD